MAAPMNQVPIICPTRRPGASLVMLLRPTGLRHSSPTVWKKYVATSHCMPTFPSTSDIDAHAITTNPVASSSRPRPNLVAIPGLRSPSLTQIMPTTGASRMMKIGLIACSAPAVISGAEERPVRQVAREQIERGARLLEARPEHRGAERTAGSTP